MKITKFIPLAMLLVVLLASPELKGAGDCRARLSLWLELLYKAGAGLYARHSYQRH